MSSILSVLASSLIMMFYGLSMYGSDTVPRGADPGKMTKIGKFMSGNSSTHDKWIVITSDTNHIDDVSALTKIPGWKVVVVGDRKIGSVCSNNECVYLSLDDQSQLGFNIVSHLPRDVPARKHVGYLYAISHGAKVIYETVSNIQLKDLLQGFLLTPTSSGLLFSGAEMFNPYRHFGQLTLWPRGYPINSVGDNDTISYLLDTWKTPFIQQALVNRNPEVDALVHLTRKRKQSTLNIVFDSRAPPAIVPSGIFSPFNAHNTLFLQEAFWAMFLPVTTPRSVSDIWRSYWAQRLLWEIGGNIGFFPPNSILKSNRGSKSADADREHDMYFKTGSLVEFLQRWTCGSRESFFSCVTTLSADMAKQRYWGNADVTLIRYWIQDLKMAGYVEPKRIPFTKHKARISRNRFRGRRDQSHLSKVQYVPEVMSPPGGDSTVEGQRVMYRQLDKASIICPKLDIKTSMTEPRHLNSHGNILLIIAFNNPTHYDAIKVFEALYTFHFPHTVYCGSTITSFSKMTANLMSPVTFVEAGVRRGSLKQKCLLRAMEMNYKVDGYLFVSEDTLLNVWTLSTLPTDRVWYIKPISLSTSHTSKHSAVQRVQSRNMVKAFHKSEHELELANKTRYMHFRKQLWKNTKFDDDGYLTQVTDVVYIPQRLKHQFLLFASTFTRNGMFHDIAVPTAIGGIVDLKDIYYLDGHHMDQGGKRKSGSDFWGYFHKNFNYLHPVNFRQSMKTTDGIAFFCNTYIPLTLGD